MSVKSRLIASLALFFKKEIISMLFLGFSAGIPLLLIFSSLSLWLGEAGVEKSTVTYFSWAALAYSFKFLWAPLVDQLPLPFLTRLLGRRRGWLIFSQGLVITAILWMASIDPSQNEIQLSYMAMAVIMLGFSSATQDTVIDAYRIEVAEVDLQSLMASTYIAGYRIGMITAGAGALILAEVLGTSKASYSYQAWQWTYYAMAAVMLIGVATSLYISEPKSSKVFEREYSNLQYLRFLLLFVIGVLVFIFSYRWLSGSAGLLKQGLTSQLANKTLATSLIEMLRLSARFGFAGVVIKANLALSPLCQKTTDRALIYSACH
ncbi:MAG: MFS transporter [Enterobacterales bacterium]|nr:MFS transporter [Enterobacterales bacterium]